MGQTTKLAQRLKSLRTEYNLKQGDFAELLGTSQQMVSAWESGKSSPDYQTLENIADYFCVSVDYLLGRKTESQQKQESDNERTLLEELFKDDKEMTANLQNIRVRLNGDIHNGNTIFKLSDEDKAVLRSVIKKYIQDMVRTGEKIMKIKRE